MLIVGPNTQSKPRASRLRVAFIVALGVCVVALITGVGLLLFSQPPAAQGLHIAELNAAALNQAIDAAGDYMNGACDASGRFKYLQHLDRAKPSSRYNVVRHAGAIYAMVAAFRRSKNPSTQAAVERATRYLLIHHVAALPNDAQRMAVWSLPGEETRDGRRQAKLGGSALGLIALTEASTLNDGLVPTTTLRALGRFILSMQDKNGQFKAKFLDDGSVDDEAKSLYYPGEAILSLVLLHEKLGGEEWLRGATLGAGYLARQRAGMKISELPADHWLMIASERLQRHLTGKMAPAASLLLQHNKDLAQAMLDEQDKVISVELQGSFMLDGRSTPTATRLEGLLALMDWLPARDPLHARLDKAIGRGIVFLMRCQMMSGEARGGILRAIAPQASAKKSFDLRQREIRIDYVQHALSAWLRYEQKHNLQPTG